MMSKNAFESIMRGLDEAKAYMNGAREGYLVHESGMKHSDFRIGLEFMMSGARWRCTDLGTRTIIAIKLDQEDESWYNGPPYAVAEMVIDEYDLDACEPIEDENP